MILNLIQDNYFLKITILTDRYLLSVRHINKKYSKCLLKVNFESNITHKTLMVLVYYNVNIS